MESAPERESIGKYKIVTPLGRGGMGFVYLARTIGPHQVSKLVVLKVLRPIFADDEEAKGLFFNEARLAARLNHPNVVQTYEVGTDGGDHFITMEFLEGQSLGAIRRVEWASPLAMAKHLRILCEVCAGLHYAHELADFDGTPLNLVHRDVTPNNVFVTYDGQIKLLDFGLAKAIWSAVKTQSGVLRGTLGYIAPEHVLGMPVDRRADVFAVGVMLWEAAARRRLWQGKDEANVLRDIVEDRIPSPRTVNPSVPLELEAICMRAIAQKLEYRYPTAAALQADLEAFVEDSDLYAHARDVGRSVGELFKPSREQLRQLLEQELGRTNGSNRSPGNGSGSRHFPATTSEITEPTRERPASASDSPKKGTVKREAASWSKWIELGIFVALALLAFVAGRCSGR
ncbi:MAG TPA: serine/threonine-protein kinase [Polyangiaceae bacterium]|jgi:serine/threonine-protein kinase